MVVRHFTPLTFSGLDLGRFLAGGGCGGAFLLVFGRLMVVVVVYFPL
jgi:hypothetical protein